MNRILTSRRLRWAVPGGVAAAVAVASLTSHVAASASGRPTLPSRTAEQLLVSLEKAPTPLLSGTVVETTHLGLPDLSSIGGSSGGSADLSLQNLLTGSHTLRVFYGGEDKQRLALLGSLSESDVVHNGKDLWTYSSATRHVTHTTLHVASQQPADPTVTGLTPTAAAQKALAAIDPTTEVQVDRTARVAGRSAYQLLLTPRDTSSLVGSVRIALDSTTSLPLRVQVFAKGASTPAIQVEFTDLTFGTPSASIFRFVKPAGTTVTEAKMPFTDAHPARLPQAHDSATKVLGKGWTSVVETTLPQGALHNELLDKASTRVADGRLVTSSLITVLITDDGRVLAGPVSPTALESLAAS